MEYLIHSLVIFLITALLIFFSRRHYVNSPKNEVLELRYSKGVLIIILIIVALVPFSGGLFFLVRFGIKSKTDLVICSIWLLVFFLIGFYILFRFTKEKIVITEEKIQAFYPFVGPKELVWKDIDNAKFCEICKWLVIETKGKQKIRLNIMLSGFQEFCKIAKQKLPYEYIVIEIDKASSATLF